MAAILNKTVFQTCQESNHKQVNLLNETIRESEHMKCSCL